MTWKDRLKEAAYNSPGGTRQTFQYENVRREVEKKTAAFDPAGADGTYIQDNGSTSRRYPLRIFFSGPNYDLEATAFEGLLEERGAGRLEHPLYGVVTVVPFGLITRRDDLKTAGNQAVLEVSFWETTGLVYPSGRSDPGSAVLAAVNAYNGALAQQTAASLDLDNAGDSVALQSTYEQLLDTAEAGLRTIADAQDNVRQQFEEIEASINRGIDVLISQPLNLIFQTALLIQAPARSAASILDRLSAYSNLATSLISGSGAAPPAQNNTRSANDFYARSAFGESYVSGSVLSAINAQFETKAGALTAAEGILAQLGEVEAWREANYASMQPEDTDPIYGAPQQVDTGQSYQALQEAVALAAGFLVEISFSLRQEKRIVLDRARTIVDLASELYGSVDDRLDFLIMSNNLTGSEIRELPRGRTIAYYV